MKALICTVITDNNFRFLSGWISQVAQEKIPRDIYIYDARTERKHNDSVHKDLKRLRYANAFSVVVKDTNEAFESMLKLGAKSDYVGLSYSQVTAIIEPFYNYNILIQSITKGAIVPVCIDDKGVFWLSTINTEKSVYSIESVDLIDDGDVAVPSLAFCVNSDILRKLSFPLNISKDEKEMFVYLALQNIGFKFTVLKTLYIRN